MRAVPAAGYKKETGYNIKDYIIQCKLSIAKDLLVNSDLPISMVANVYVFRVEIVEKHLRKALVQHAQIIKSIGRIAQIPVQIGKYILLKQIFSSCLQQRLPRNF